jgi:hypothetical protein
MIGARFAPNVPLAQEDWCIVLLGDEAQVKAHFFYLEIVLILTQDWCMVCAECTIASKIILDTPNGTPR